MDWADELAASVDGPQVVNDSKTPSGTVHVGSLRGPVILDVITRALRARGLETTLLYGVDDLDPMDAQALLSPDAIEREMGRPLAHVPDPAGDCHASYARHFAGIFIDMFAGLGIVPDRYYWMSDIYPTGQMDPFIRTALDRAESCATCTAGSPTSSTPTTGCRWASSAPTAARSARRSPPTGTARRCPSSASPTSSRGRRLRLDRPGRPFGGDAKLPWNLEWAAQWSLFGVTIEPNGKDLADGGRLPRPADAIAREVFEREPPLNFPYEFLNIGGRKMSTSKGRGAAAHTIGSVIPPEQLRFLFVRQRPESALEFDPEGTDAIPRLFDEFDRLARRDRRPRRQGRAAVGLRLDLPLLAPRPGGGRRGGGGRVPPRRSRHLALLVQVPGIDVRGAGRTEKGSAADRREAAELEVRLAAVRRWLEEYAPERALIEIRRDALPAEVELLRPEQLGLPPVARQGRPRRGPLDRRAVAGRDLRRRRGARPRREGRLQRALPHVPRAAERAARRLAARQPRARLRHPPPHGGRRGRGGDRA